MTFPVAAEAVTGTAVPAPIPNAKFAKQFRKRTNATLVIINAGELLRQAGVKEELFCAGNKKEKEKVQKALEKEFQRQGIEESEAYWPDVMDTLSSQGGKVIWFLQSGVCIYVSSGNLGSFENVVMALAGTDCWKEGDLKKLDFSRIGIDRKVLTGKSFQTASNYHERAHALGQTASVEEFKNCGERTERKFLLMRDQENIADTFSFLMMAARGEGDVVFEMAKPRFLGYMFAGPSIYATMVQKQGYDSKNMNRFSGTVYRTDESIAAAQKFADDVKNQRWDIVETTLKQIFTSKEHLLNNDLLKRPAYNFDLKRLMATLMKKGGIQELAKDRVYGEADIYALSVAFVDSVPEYKRVADIGYMRGGGSIEEALKIIKIYYVKDTEKHERYLRESLARAYAILQPPCAAENKLIVKAQKEVTKAGKLALLKKRAPFQPAKHVHRDPRQTNPKTRRPHVAVKKVP